MSNEEYFQVFEAILYGAIVAELLIGWSKLLTEKGKYKFYWAHFLATVTIFLVVIQRYFSGRDLAHYQSIQTSYEFLFYIVLTPAIFFLAVSQMFPKRIAGVDFRILVIEKRAVFGGAFLIYLLANLFVDLQTVENEMLRTVFVHLIFIIPFVLIIISKNLRLTEILVVLMFLMFQYFMFIEY